MSDKFNNIYKIETTRLKAWDYTKPGKYFVTICTHRRKEFFGEIIDKKMFLSDIGKIADVELQETEKIRKNIKLDKYVIMPNHIHGIIQIIKNDNESYHGGIVETRRDNNVGTRRYNNVETRHASSLHDNNHDHDHNHNHGNNHNHNHDHDQNKSKIQQQMSKISPKPGSLSVIIGSFKSAVTKTANAVGCLSNGINNKYPCKNFVWQSRFNDHIIRDKESLYRIRRYISKNPETWDNDINNIKK